MTNKIGDSLKNVLWLPIVYIILFSSLLLIVWGQLDKTAIVAVVSVIGGGLAGVIGSFVGAIIAVQRVEKESENKIKEYASSQALELTKLELEMRQKEGKQKQILAAAKIYREYYKALFELYDKKEWPEGIAKQGLINIYDFTEIKKEIKEDERKPT